MADLVLDEWLWSDLAGENSTQKQSETFQLLKAIYWKCDRIVTVQGSRFAQKAERFFRHTDVTRRQIARYYRNHFWYNSLKCRILEEDQLLDLPAQIVAKVNRDDHYVVRAYLTAKASVIVTTDIPLKGALAEQVIPCKLRDEFVPDYIA